MVAVDLELIGREGEQTALDQALAVVHSGAGGILLLAGEAGVGKTRLLEACLARSDLLVLKGETNEIATPPYGPIISALRAYLRANNRLGSCAEETPPTLVDAIHRPSQRFWYGW